MKVYEITGAGIDSVKLSERAVPKPGPREALIRVRATSLNYRDLVTAKNAAALQVKLPRVPLSDGAGEVAEVGPGVERVKKGDRVAAAFFQEWLSGPPRPTYGRSALGGAIDGMLAEYVCLNENGLVRIPDYMTYEEAASLPCAAVTSWNALVSEGRLKSGDTVLVMGTGGVSIFALQFALMHGARVIATSSSDAKLKRLTEMGASDVINYKTTPEWDKRALEITHGEGVDYVIEVGGIGTLEKSLRAVRVGGQVSLIGILAGGTGINPMPVLFKSVRLQGIYVGSRDMFDEMNRAMEVSRVHPVIDHTFSFDQVREAYRHLESGAHFGKVCIKV
ncbi:MAG TPA: NAD(P)-dependent alcohol dehydrogenase [Candidatus Binataceae bacterium]|nr:NAD(P)-dependent alcohol dehydrogenase [Candidatus Binataceae bacterium]